MQGVVARRNNFIEPILEFFEDAYSDFGELTGRYYGLVSQYKTDDADTVFVSLGSAAENIEAAVDYLREHARREGRLDPPRTSSVRSRKRPIVKALAGKKNVIILERTDEPLAGDNPMGRDIRTALQQGAAGRSRAPGDHGRPDAAAVRRRLRPRARATSGPSTRSAPTSSPSASARARTASARRTASRSSCSASITPTK